MIPTPEEVAKGFEIDEPLFRDTALRRAVAKVHALQREEHERSGAPATLEAVDLKEENKKLLMSIWLQEIIGRPMVDSRDATQCGAFKDYLTSVINIKPFFKFEEW
jgi:hypothetical protein